LKAKHREQSKESNPREQSQESNPGEHLTSAIQERNRGEQSQESYCRRAIAGEQSQENNPGGESWRPIPREQSQESHPRIAIMAELAANSCR